MKKLTTVLGRGDMKPRERILLLVHNKVHKDTTGKEILTEADKTALGENWKPKNDYEAREWNKYNNAWRLEGELRLDMQTEYLGSVILLLRAEKLVDYAMWKDHRNTGHADIYKNLNLEVDDATALDFILKNICLEFDSVVYGSAFESLSDDVKKDLMALYPDIKTERHYLIQEEVVASFFSGTDQLTSESKEKLADVIVEAMHNKYIEAFKEKNVESDEWRFYDYYADLPLVEVAKRWADEHTLYDQKEIEELEKKGLAELQDILTKKVNEYGGKYATNMRDSLRKTVRVWLDDGLFVRDYEPLCRSTRKETCNDADTTLPHNEVFAEWMKAKTKVQATIHSLVDGGKLKVEERTRSFLKITETLKILTGESLYALEGDYAFAGSFRKQADDIKPLGHLVLFLRKRDILKDYAILLGFVDIYAKLSRVYEIDMGYKIREHIEDFGKEIGRLNMELRRIADKLEEAIHLKHGVSFFLEVFMDGILYCLDGIEPFVGETAQHYSDEFKKILKDEFQ
jgi:hypothetical protein